MAIYKIVTYPDPALLQKTEPVESVGPRERLLIQDMIDTMHVERGVGLAANQISIPLQIFVASADGIRGKELAFFNPKIIKRRGRIREYEGCLSLPEVHEPVARYRRVTLRAMNLKGEIVEVEASGLLGRIFQHEVDHLNGSLLVHHLGWFKKRKIFKNMDKEFKSKEI